MVFTHRAAKSKTDFLAVLLFATGLAFQVPAVQVVLGAATLVFPMATSINVGEEKVRLEKEIIRLGGEIERIDNKLSNKNFIEKAPKDVVEAEKVKRDDYEKSLSKVNEALERIA